MSGDRHESRSTATVAVNSRLAEATHLQAIEGNPLTAEETAMFEMFEREGWSPERRRAHVLRQSELRAVRALADELVRLDEAALGAMLASGTISEVICDDQTV